MPWPDSVQLAHRPAASHSTADLTATDTPPPGFFQTLYAALENSTVDQIGRATPRLLVIPLYGPYGDAVGGFWGCTLFQWLHVQMMFVPDAWRGLGVGSALLQTAETEARARGCRGAHVDSFSFQAVPFYQKCGFSPFGILEDFPPGHRQFFMSKRLALPTT
jgi:GNAT superfamily N-acetyltransferase